MTEEKTIGSKINAWRAKKDMTQDELAKKAEIAEGLGITVDELLE